MQIIPPFNRFKILQSGSGVSVQASLVGTVVTLLAAAIRKFTVADQLDLLLME
jgi:hypothetical protein